MPAPGPADESADVQTQATGETKTTHDDGNTVILSNGNKITSVTRQTPN